MKNLHVTKEVGRFITNIEETKKVTDMKIAKYNFVPLIRYSLAFWTILKVVKTFLVI